MTYYYSCSNAFIKIFESVNLEKTKKIFHLCSIDELKNISIKTNIDIIIITVQTSFRLEYLHTGAKKYKKEKSIF